MFATVLVRRMSVRVLVVLLATILVSTAVAFVPVLRVAARAAGAPAPAASGPAERPDLISAQLAARAEKRRIEVTDARTETTSTFVNPDGSTTVESASGVVRVRQGDGWVPVDPRLAVVGGKVVPKAVKGTVTLSAGSSSAGDLASLADAGKTVGFTWPDALPAPKLTGNVATYTGVAAGTDLVVEVLPTGFDVRIVAHTAAAAKAAVHLPLRLSGMTATRTAGGEVRLSAGGKTVMHSPTPVMWDAHKDPHTGLPDQTRTVETSLDTAKADTPSLTLKPNASWLDDPARQYPVTIDPAAVLADTLDTDVNNASPTTNYDTGTTLRVGNFLGTTVNRSFLKFDSTTIASHHVSAATLQLTQLGSATCTAEPTLVQGSAALAAGATWNTQPASDGTTWANSSFNVGTDNSCGTGAVSLDITTLAQAWAANGLTAETLTLRAGDESDANQFKYFDSGDTTSPPKISVTYNGFPGTVANRSTIPCSAQCGGTPATVLTNTTTPTLRGAATDPDGTPLRLDFEIWNASGTTQITSGSVSNIPSNATGSWTVPSGVLTNGTSYEWRARAFDGLDYSPAWSDWIPFTVDTTAPAAPSAVASTAWPTAGGWTTTTSGTFTWTSPGGDTQSFLYDVDQPSPATETTSTATATLTPAAGLHTFYLRTKDKAGNLSPVVSYVFGVGTGALQSPADGSRTQRYTTLEAQAPASQVSVTLQYHLGQASSAPWVNVPTGDLTVAGTTTHPSWPMARNGSGLFDRLTWDAGATMTAIGAPEGPLQVQACFRTSTGTVTCAPARTVQFARHAFADALATSPVGPGTAALLTGDYSVSATDASLPSYTGSVSLGRTYTTLATNPPGAGLAIDASSPPVAGWNGQWFTVAGDATTASFTAPANALLLALADGSSLQGGASTGPVISDSGGLTWNQIGTSGTSSSKDEAIVWWAKTSSATARTVTLHGAANNTGSKFLKVLVLTGANLINPIGVTNIGPASTTSGTLSQSITSSTSGAMAFAAVADWNFAGTPTPSAGTTLAGSYYQSEVGGSALYRTAAATGPGQTMTIATTAPTNALNSWVMFEVLPAGASTSVFGPGWTASMPGPDAGTADQTLTDSTSSGGFVTLTDEAGVQSVYTATSTSSYPYSYTGVGDAGADGTKLTKDSATQFTLTDIDGTKTVYTAQTVGGVTVWRAGQVVEPGANTTTSFTTDTAGRTTRILAPVPAGVSCTTLVAGCRALTLTYATSVTATGNGTNPATWGDYTGRLTAVAMALNGATPITVAAYTYDTDGRLRSASDPRTGLATVYSYDSSGRLSTITPPGQATWTFTYDSSSRISTVSRPAPGGGTATQTLAYDIPVTGTGSPIDLSSGQVAGWAQTDLPVYAAGVFTADHVPSSPPVAADWPYADLTYLDTAGRAVNTASYGNNAWQITTTEHDAKGNVIRTLSAENRNQALTPTADTDPTVAALTTSAARSQQLDNETVYTSDGVLVTDTYGPTHPIVDDSGNQYSGREHTHTDYDEGAPGSGGPYRLATTVTSSVRVPNGTDLDIRKTINGYAAKSGADPNTAGWVLRKPTTVTTWMGGGSTPDIVHTTYYDLAGNVVESRQPAANSTGTDAYTTLTTYYTATGSGGCVNASFTGLVCTTGPAAQPSSGSPLPVSTYTYNNLGEVLTKADAVTVSGTTTTRTTTYTYDSAGRKTSEAVAVSPAANGGTAIPTASYGYDSASGLPTTRTANSITLTTGYNSWGQVSSQTDADGNSSTTSYDIDGRVSAEADGKGTYSYVYDGTSGEHRGLVTSLGVGAGTAPSTFTATYDGDGKLTSQTYPNGLVATTHYDNVEQPTSLTYAKSGTTWLSFSQTRSVHGQVRRDATPPATKTIGYDLDGRLNSVIDAVSYGGPRNCTTRLYSYDAESNRTWVTSYPDAGGHPDTGNCSTTTSPTGYPSTYDQADRLTTTGYTYDLFGRTTTDPYTPSGSADTIGYYTNDLVASETVGSTTRTYTLDPARRFRSWTDAGGATSTNHYTTSSGDSPAWMATGTSWTRNITGIDGGLAAVQADTGTVTLQLANLHGDTVATADDTTTATSTTSYTESNEFGVPYFQASAYPRYGWLGAKQRSHDTLSGITLMGVRLYNPDSGRFDQTDPVPGGSANPYDYANQDPINGLDLDGRRSFIPAVYSWRVAFRPFGRAQHKLVRVTARNHYVRQCGWWGGGAAIAAARSGRANMVLGFVGGCAAGIGSYRWG